MKKKAFHESVCFCYDLGARHHIGPDKSRKISWIPGKDRVEQRIAAKILITAGV